MKELLTKQQNTEPKRSRECSFCGRCYLERPRSCCAKGREWDIAIEQQRITGEPETAETAARQPEGSAACPATRSRRQIDGSALSSNQCSHWVCGNDRFTSVYKKDDAGCPYCEIERLRAALVSVQECISHQDFMRVRRVVSAALSGDASAPMCSPPDMPTAAAPAGLSPETRAQLANFAWVPWHPKKGFELESITDQQEDCLILANGWQWVPVYAGLPESDSGSRPQTCDVQVLQGSGVSEIPIQRVVNAAGTAAYDVPQIIEVNEDGSPLETTERCIHGAVACAKCATMAINSAQKASAPLYGGKVRLSCGCIDICTNQRDHKPLAQNGKGDGV